MNPYPELLLQMVNNHVSFSGLIMILRHKINAAAWALNKRYASPGETFDAVPTLTLYLI